MDGSPLEMAQHKYVIFEYSFQNCNTSSFTPYIQLSLSSKSKYANVTYLYWGIMFGHVQCGSIDIEFCLYLFVYQNPYFCLNRFILFCFRLSFSQLWICFLSVLLKVFDMNFWIDSLMEKEAVIVYCCFFFKFIFKKTREFIVELQWII